MTKVEQEKSFGFHLNVGKTFADLTSFILNVPKKAIAQKIHKENFHVSSKICKNRETFLMLNFCHSCGICTDTGTAIL